MNDLTSGISSADDKTRRIGVAVASWLCGTLEGIARDNADMALAEALDSWLRQQKHSGETLYTGNIICSSCGHPWECLVLSSDTGSVQCPHCGAVQKFSPPAQKSLRTEPGNMDALEKVQKQAGDVVSQIASLNEIIKKYHPEDEKTC